MVWPVRFPDNFALPLQDQGFNARIDDRCKHGKPSACAMKERDFAKRYITTADNEASALVKLQVDGQVAHSG
jgi:hypothetical protein